MTADIMKRKIAVCKLIQCNQVRMAFLWGGVFYFRILKYEFEYFSINHVKSEFPLSKGITLMLKTTGTLRLTR